MRLIVSSSCVNAIVQCDKVHIAQLCNVIKQKEEKKKESKKVKSISTGADIRSDFKAL